MPQPADPRLELVYSDARDSIKRQATKLDELRARGVAVLTASSISAGLLGPAAIKPPIDTLTRSGIALAVLSALLAALVLLPDTGWVFSRDPHKLLESYVDNPDATSVDQVRCWAVMDLGDNYASNNRRLRLKVWLLFGSVIGLVLEIFVFFVALASA